MTTKAILQYLIATGEKPVYTASTGGAQAKLNISAQFEKREVRVDNARLLRPSATLDKEGFALANQATQVARRSIHSAFENSAAPEGAPARESIESRALLFFESAEPT